MTQRKFVALYIQRKRSVLHDQWHTIEWCLERHQMGCSALKSLDIDCTELHKAVKDVQDSVNRLYKVQAESSWPSSAGHNPVRREQAIPPPPPPP